MALNARLLTRGILSCHGFRSGVQCRAVTIQPRPVAPVVSETHDEKNMRLGRPQSPHLTIYKFQLTSMLSITHRFTGIALSGYAAAFAFASMASSKPMPEIINNLSQCNPHFFLLFKLGLLFPFTYHFFNGIRHLIWDMGQCLSLKGVYISGYLMLLFAIGTFAGIVYYTEELKKDEELKKIEAAAAAKAAAEAEAAAAAEAEKNKKKKKK